MQKVIIETGTLSRNTKIAGRSLFVAAALCVAGTGISGYMSTSHFEEFLTQKDVTPEQIAQQVGRITHALGASWWFLFVGLGLMVLGIGCYFFGARNPAPRPDEQT